MKAMIHGELTKQEKRALEAEIRRQIIEHEVEYQDNIDAMILYYLHERFGFGKKRLREFYDCLTKGHNEIKDYYQLNNQDICEVYKDRLNKIGVDVVQWNKEVSVNYE